MGGRGHNPNIRFLDDSEADTKSQEEREEKKQKMILGRTQQKNEYTNRFVNFVNTKKGAFKSIKIVTEEPEEVALEEKKMLVAQAYNLTFEKKHKDLVE